MVKKIQMDNYIVCLPKWLDSVNYHSRLFHAYAEIPKVGETLASSIQKAVTNLIFRNQKDLGSLIIRHLKDQSKHEDLRPFAFKMPDIRKKYGAGESLTYNQVELIKTYELAKSIGDKQELDYEIFIPRAIRVLSELEK